ncbi:MAG: hypothetical protein E7311_04535 [Clostridiales bacterium]|nr:hypothetical protein [Clostridiales bacterium]
MKYIFIINTLAGKGKYKRIVPNIENICSKENIEYEIRYITEKLSGKDIIKEYKNEENIIYSVGGDGTLSNILQEIVGTKNILGVIPAGSGNDTYRTIKKLPQGENLVDIGKVNNIYFINVACTGIDAEVGNNLDKLRKTKIPSSQLYNASIIYTFFKFKFKKIKIKTNVKNFEDSYTILSICNGGFYGGGFNISPKSDMTDGLLEIYFAEKMPKIKMIPLLLKLKKGKHVGKKRVHKFRTNHIELKLEEDIVFNVDGEKLIDNEFIIDIIPKAIKIYNNEEFVNKIIGGEKNENSIN